MFIAIVLGIAVVVLGIIYAIKEHDGNWAGVGVVGGVILCGVLCMVALGVGSCESLYEWETSTMSNLVAINDGSSIHGSFFIGCGTIDEREYYFFYYETRSGGMKKSRLPVSNVTIYEDNSVKPHIKIHKTRFENWNYWIFAIRAPGERYSIYVPKGSVKRDFTFDLE